ncbi:MAG: hypothetical protein QXJ74_05895 [Nitrososphaera sp.]|uniref:hypothetical protein n=1 Tax=Nitrososphaera sp. TaxID=1971748 RepID=UPI0017E76DF4|nr:hypothetical protein [Nitrososphaera sp.]NWG37178.1 hypothetical protein [Nitrososphaera sp.]
MVDEIRLGVVLSIVVIAVPTFIIVSQFKTEASGLQGLGALQASAAQDELLASNRLATSNPEEALYMMYDAQAQDELERCSDPGLAQLCEGTIELIADSCADSLYDLAVCHDPRIEQLVPKA